MKKILCIADSLGLPGHLNRYEDTWIYHLKQGFPDIDFLSFFMRQLTTDVLVTMGGGERGIDNWPKGADCLESYLPNTVIIQLGIVDCAPRLLTKYDRALLKISPKLLKSILLRLIKKIRKRNIKNTIVPFEKFKSNLLNYARRAKALNVELILISISIPDHNMIEKNKEIITNVNKYNSFYRELATINSFVKVIKPLQPIDYNYAIYEDGYHPNPIGHQIIYYELKNALIGFN